MSDVKEIGKGKQRIKQRLSTDKYNVKLLNIQQNTVLENQVGDITRYCHTVK